MGTYKVVRMFQDERIPRRTVRRGLTLEEARAHCADPETSSKTCRKPENLRRTRSYGPWFDAYEAE